METPGTNVFVSKPGEVAPMGHGHKKVITCWNLDKIHLDQDRKTETSDHLVDSLWSWVLFGEIDSLLNGH